MPPESDRGSIPATPAALPSASPRPPTPLRYVLDDVLKILRTGNSKILHGPRRIKHAYIDQFLFSGRFNSVLGLKGFSIFKAKLREVVAEVNENDCGPRLLTLDRMFEVLLDSGVFYVDKHLPEELAFLKTDERWLTAYRYIAKNFPDLSYSDFRVIVGRFKQSRGYSFYVEASDSPTLQSIGERSALFEFVVDAKAALLQMTMRDLRSLCQREGITPARSLADTADRIIEKCGDVTLTFVDNHHKARRSLVIKAQELASGEDILRLDAYLRAISKVIRDDLIGFVMARRHTTWLSEE